MKQYLNNFKTWFSTQADIKAAYLSALSSLLMTIIAIIMCYTLIQNNKALRISSRALEMQQAEFKIRNRPFLSITPTEFAGPGRSESGKEYPRSLLFNVKNNSNVPAYDLNGRCLTIVHVPGKTYIDGMEFPFVADHIAANQTYTNRMFLSEEIYQGAMQEDNRFTIIIYASYKGILNNDDDIYKIAIEGHYYPEEKSFRIATNVAD